MEGAFDVAGLGNALVDALVRIEDDSVLDELGAVRGRMKPCDHAEWEHALHRVRGDHHVEIQSGGSCANTPRHARVPRRATTRFCGQVGSDQMGALYRSRHRRGLRRARDPRHGRARQRESASRVISGTDAERTMFTRPRRGDAAPGPRRLRRRHPPEPGPPPRGLPLPRRADARRARSKRWRSPKAARRRGERRPVGSVRRRDVRDLMWSVCVEHADIVFLNAEEARLLCGGTAGERTRDARRRLRHRRVEARCRRIDRLARRPERGPIDAQRVETVDTTGAGDAYAGGYLFGRLRGLGSRSAGQLASRVAAATVSQVGAVVPRSRALEALVASEVCRRESPARVSRPGRSAAIRQGVVRATRSWWEGDLLSGGLRATPPEADSPRAARSRPSPHEGRRVGRNYARPRQGARQRGPDAPRLFLKPSTAVIGPGDAILLPPQDRRSVDHEAELGVVIGRTLDWRRRATR